MFSKNKEILFWLLVGLLLRIICMPLFYHNDFVANVINSSYLFDKGILNIYEYIASDPQNHFDWPYPPLTYYLLGASTWLLKLFGLSFINLSNPSFRDLFLGKIPFLSFDLLAGFLLISLFKQRESKIKVFKGWMLSPIVIFVSFIMGQLDILAVCFVIFTFVLISRKRLSWAALTLGLAASIKYFPIILLPVLLVYIKNWKDRFLFTSISLGIFAFYILPFCSSKAFWDSCLFSWQAEKFASAILVIGGAQIISLTILLYIILLSFFMFSSYKSEADKTEPNNDPLEKLIYSNSAVLLVFFAFSEFHPQWFLWIIPFLIWLQVKHPELRLLTFSINILFFIYLLNWPGAFYWDLFRPLNPEYFRQIPSLTKTLSSILPLNSLSIITRSLFSGVLIFLALFSLRQLYLKQVNDHK